MKEQTENTTQVISRNYRKLNRYCGEYDPGNTPCPKTKDAVHEVVVVGRPLSGNTYNKCVACGLKWFRG